ncbi:MAG: DUF2605 domain-containing protein [Synechococcales cyanobacterium]
MNQADLLRQILSPLIEDYKYWFERSHRLLSQQVLSFLTPEDQQALLERVEAAQAELGAADMLYQLSEQQVGIDPALMAKWHHLLMECAELGRRFYASQSSSEQG